MFPIDSVIDIWISILVWGVGIIVIMSFGIFVFGVVDKLVDRVNIYLSPSITYLDSPKIENFFIEGEFYSNIEQYVDNMDFDSMEDMMLDDNWRIQVELADKEPIFKVNLYDIADDLYDRNEERFPADNTTFYKVKNVLEDFIDIDSINKNLPKLYYPNGTFAHITKEDIFNHLHIKL